MTTVEEALRSYLADQSALTDVVESRIRTVHAEQGILKPYIVIEMGTSRDSYHATGCSGKASSFIDVRCVAERYEDSRALSETVKTICGGFRGLWSDLDIDSCIPSSLRPEFVFPASGDEDGFQTVVVELTIWHAVEIPTN